MSNIRMKIAAGATILGLGGLAGYAISSNDAANPPAASTLAAAKQGPDPEVRTQVIRRTVHLHADGAAQASGPSSAGAASAGPPAQVAADIPVALRSRPGSASAAVVTGSSGSGSGAYGDDGDDAGDRDEYRADDDDVEFEADDADAEFDDD